MTRLISRLYSWIRAAPERARSAAETALAAADDAIGLEDTRPPGVVSGEVLVPEPLPPPPEPLTVERALSMISYAPDGAEQIRYRLGAGGRDPDEAHPAAWSSERLRWEVDCSGFAAWCLGLDRYQPKFPLWGGWISTDSIVADAHGAGVWFRRIDRPEPGCLAVYPGIREGGKRVRVGHMGVVVAVSAGYEPGRLDRVRVVHASSGLCRRTGGAIGETDASAWRVAGSIWVRYVALE
jgi:hypothetical protein